MKIKLLKSLFLILFSFTQFCFSQVFSETFLKQNAKIIMSQSKTCVLTTINNQGAPSSRIMDPFIPNNDFIVYLVTNPQSRKVSEIKKDPRVSLIFQNLNGYVSMSGKVTFISKKLNKNFWKKEWNPYYKNKDTAQILKVTPLVLEIINSDVGIVGDNETWSPVKINFEY